MESVPKKIFISYVEEDGAVAHELAAGLESHGYSSWYYERDCPAGADYFEETFKAISDCEAMVVLISPRSLPSDQVTREIVRAVESSKATLPLLLEISHDDYAHRRPGWKQAMAAANATRIPVDSVSTVVPALVAGLSAKGIQADANGHEIPVAPARHTTQTPRTKSATTASASPSSAVSTSLPPALTQERVDAIVAKPVQPIQVAARTSAAAQPLPWTMIGIAAAVVIAAGVGWFVYSHRPPKPVPTPPAATTATVMFHYANDRHKCTPDLNVSIAGKSYHPTSSPFAASGVPAGAQEYTVDGLISCPGRKAIKASGSGAIDVREGAVFDLAWQTKPGGISNVDIVRTADNGDSQAAGGDNGNSAPNVVPHAVKPAPTPAPAPAPAPVPVAANAGQLELENAQRAYAQGHYFGPPNGSALYWAIQARVAGNQGGRVMETQIVNMYKADVLQLYQQRNYPAALQLVNAMLNYYPGEQGLLQDQQKIMMAANGGGPPNQNPFNPQMPNPQYQRPGPPRPMPVPGPR
jgi:hypothetical protein